MSLRELLFDGCEVITLRFPFGDVGAAPAPLVVDAGAALYAGSAEDSTIAALLTNDLASVEVAFGAIQSGARLVSLPLPGRGSDVLAYATWLRETVVAVGATRVVARPDLAELLQSVGIPALGHHDLRAGPPLARAGSGFSLVQFSSGSTGPPMPIELDSTALEANLRAILGRVAPRSGDVTVSWLPLSHDMGFVGMLLASMGASSADWTEGGDVVLLPPEQFLRDPGLWVRALSDWKGTFTAAPDFAFRLAVRSTSSAADLSRLRNVIVGGEVVRPSTLREVDTAWGTSGMESEALAPAYGLAEVGLAVAITGPSERWRQVETTDGFEIAASGRPLDGYDVEVDPATGALTIRAPSVGRHGFTGQPLGDHDSLTTGDVGFLTHDGWLCVTGRADDTIVVHGRNVYAPALEGALSDVPGVRPGRTTAVGLRSGGWIVAVELERSSDVEGGRHAVIQAVRRCSARTVGARPDEVVVLDPGRLPMTSSGKLRRNEVRRLWEEGSLSST